MIILKKCPICSGKKLTKKLSCKDFTFSMEKFTIVSCETCDFTFTNPRPDDDSLQHYYKSESYISHTNSTKGLFNLIYQKIRSYTIKRKVVLLKKLGCKGKHLDIGCGTGEFLHACASSGLKCMGIEPSKLARTQAIKNYNLSVSSDTNLGNIAECSFDSITMWHVLEHLPDVVNTVSGLQKILKKKGKVIIGVPNHKCLDAKIYKEYWAAWDVPIHLWHFSQHTIETLFKKNNFKLIQKKPMIFDSFYVSLLSEQFKTGKKNYLRSLAVGFISNIYATLSKKGHSSIIYIFEK